MYGAIFAWGCPFVLGSHSQKYDRALLTDCPEQLGFASILDKRYFLVKMFFCLRYPDQVLNSLQSQMITGNFKLEKQVKNKQTVFFYAMVLSCVIIVTIKGQKVLHSCAQLLLTKPQQLPLKYSDFHPVAFHPALHLCRVDLQYRCCNWNMILTLSSSFQSSIFQVFVTLTIWFPTSVLAKAWLSPQT